MTAPRAMRCRAVPPRRARSRAFRLREGRVGRRPARLRAARVALAHGLALGLAPACASFADAPSDRVGCYQFRRDAGARALGLPWGMELRNERLEEDWPVALRFPDARTALTATSALERSDHPFGYWRVAEGDSVEVGHPGGGGFSLLLASEGQDLVGRGIAVGDALAPGRPPGLPPVHPVVAYRVLCGAI